jgi:hypothetical protein
VKLKDKSKSSRKRLGVPMALACVLATMTAFAPDARAQKNVDAVKALKAMSDYVSGQKTFSVTFDSDVEVITSELQKIQFTVRAKCS